MLQQEYKSRCIDCLMELSLCTLVDGELDARTIDFQRKWTDRQCETLRHLIIHHFIVISNDDIITSHINMHDLN